jgi:pilus assembly protein CpaC
MISSSVFRGSHPTSHGRVAALLVVSWMAFWGAVPPGAGQGAPPEEAEKILLTAGRSTVLTTSYDVTRIAVTNPEVADGVVVAPREVLIDGKSAGTVSLILWGAGGERTAYDVVVDPGVPPLQQAFQSLFPGEDIRVSVNEDAIILSGRVSSNDVKLRAGDIASTTSSKSKVVNLLELPQEGRSQQVMLQVRFAEVNRRALRELGVNLFLARDEHLGRVTTQQFPTADFEAGTATGDEGGTLVFSDFLNIFYFNRKEGIGAVIKALQQKGYFQSLAEPNLIAYDGQEASFLAGGEFPVPIVQGISGAVNVQFKEFGVRLTFRPTIAGDTIRLKVRPEVSSLDFNNGITLEGFRIPALTTRRAETEVELRDGQSFAIAGLMNNIAQDDTHGIPWLSAIPIIGYLFKSKADRQEQTELLVLITPRLVRPLNPDEVPSLPTMPGRFLPQGEAPPGQAPPPRLQDGPSGVQR